MENTDLFVWKSDAWGKRKRRPVVTCDYKRMHKDVEEKAVHRRHTEMAPWCKAAFTAARHDVSHLSRLFFFPQ